MPRSTSFPVRHQTFRGRNDRHSQTVHHLGQPSLPPVDSQTRSADSIQLLDYRSPFEISKNNRQLRLTIYFFYHKIAYVSLVLQYSCDFLFVPRHRHHRSNLSGRLPIPNACQHVRYRILHAHRHITSPLVKHTTNWPLPDRVCLRSSPLHAIYSDQDQTCGRKHVVYQSICTCSESEQVTNSAALHSVFSVLLPSRRRTTLYCE